MKKTTIYLPEDLKRAIEEKAKREQKSEAMIIRDALIVEAIPEPSVPLTGKPLGDPTIAERVDELLHGFGKWE